MPYQTIDNIPVFGDPLSNAVEQMRDLVAPDANYVALMADHHLGYSMPIGGVAAYQNKVSPSGVGFDIACGNKAVQLDTNLEYVTKNINQIMDEIWGSISFGMGRNNDTSVASEVLDWNRPAWQIVSDISRTSNKGKRGLYDIACNQLGTVGSGNHYIDIFTSSQDKIWIGVHFGSRGLGHKIANYFIKKAGGKDGINVPATLLDVDSELGQQYLECMHLAGDYAYAGRDWVCQQVADIIGGQIVDQVHNHHNFAWYENHAAMETIPPTRGFQLVERGLWVVRKGATPAFPGQRGFIGGSMGEDAVIIEGIDSEDSRVAMYSTIHGAGRIMSRTEAAGKINRKTGEVKKPGKITREMMHDWINERGVCLRGGGCDESPHCYKRLPDILGHHHNTIKILEVLTPIGVAMAGPETHDPYKD